MLVTNDCCQLFTVVRTDMSTTPWTMQELPYAPRSFMNAVSLAAIYQRRFDPDKRRYDYRVSMAG